MRKLKQLQLSVRVMACTERLRVLPVGVQAFKIVDYFAGNFPVKSADHIRPRKNLLVRPNGGVPVRVTSRVMQPPTQTSGLGAARSGRLRSVNDLGSVGDAQAVIVQVNVAGGVDTSDGGQIIGDPCLHCGRVESNI
ncbi:MAG: hypothetical protein R2788_17960 [Saprospiraceae bacterium]